VARCNALDEVVRFAELIGARIYQAWMSDVNFPVTHPQYLGDLDPTAPPAREVFQSADMLIGIGCPMFGQGFYNPDRSYWDHLKIIQFDENPWEIGINFPIDCGVQGDIKVALAELNAMLENQMPSDKSTAASERINTIVCQKGQQTDRLRKQIDAEMDRQSIAISRLMTDLKKVVGPDTVIVDDCWTSSAMLRQVLDLTESNTFFRARNGGSIGSGPPMALRVQLGLPDKNVIAVSGDGSAAWSMQTL